MDTQPNLPVPTKYSYKVTDQLYASEYPIMVYDVDSSEKLTAMIEFGITDFIDLTEPGELHPYEQFLPDGVRHWSFPIRDMNPPPSSEYMDNILAKINELLAEGRVVCVHCWGGMGRTGSVITCWLGKTNQWDFAQTRKYQLNLWRTNPKSQRTPQLMNETQVNFLRQYLGGKND
jgi:protein-tyrosine phosphatase